MSPEPRLEAAPPDGVAIVGLGLMGASLGRALRAVRPGLAVVGVDEDPAVVEKALERGVATRAGGAIDLVAGAEIVVLAVPIRAMPSVLDRLAPHAGGAAVTDLASTKAAVMGWAASAGVDLVGGHPMAGRESGGIDAADPGLFRGAPWALTRRDARVEWMVRATGARPLIIDADSHDRLVAGVSHAAFLLSAAYVLALAGRPDWGAMSALAGPGYRDLSRLAEGDPEMYLGVAQTNRAHMLDAIDSVRGEIDRLRAHLESGDERLGELLEEARSVRGRWRREREVAGGGPAPD